MTRRTLIAAIAFLVLTLAPGHARCADIPTQGGVLPDMTFQAPPVDRDRTALGLGDAPTFRLADLPARVWVVEVIGVYCQFCHEQLPGMNKLAKRVQKAGLAGKVRMLALAAGGTPAEVENLQQSAGGYAFPMVPDDNYPLHKALGEPKTPFTLVIGPDGKVAYAHLGVVQDFDRLFALIRDLAK